MDIDHNTVRRLFDYNKDTGCLTWRVRDRDFFASEMAQNWHNNMYAGKRAGSVKTDYKGHTFRRVCIFYKVFAEHRVIWLYMTGSWPEDQVDHIDQDATNNRWCNLRESSSRQNMKNRPMQSNNMSGVTGVGWNKKRGKWVARVGHNRKLNYLGSYDHGDLDIAAMEVMEFYAENGFSDNHGKQ